VHAEVDAELQYSGEHDSSLEDGARIGGVREGPGGDTGFLGEGRRRRPTEQTGNNRATLDEDDD
jgi:hypothetical protein